MKRDLFSAALATLSIALAAAAMTACSSSPSEGDLGDEMAMGDEIPDLEAGTDAVPLGDLEQIENIEGADFAAGGGGDGLSAPADPVAMTDPTAGSADSFGDDMGSDPLAHSESTPPASDPLASDPAPVDSSASDSHMASSSPSYDSGTASDTFSGGHGDTEGYTVQRGDTLMKIAFETYGDLYQWRKIYEMNQDLLQDPNSLPPGITLKLERPSSPVHISREGERYLIKVGDTLGTISDDIYGTPSKWRKLWENNRQLIKDPNRIFAGFYLYYVITPEEQNEADRLRQMRDAAPPPLATSEQYEDRGPAAIEAGPASAEAPAPVPVTPGT